jgi:hypothetical protein
MMLRRAAFVALAAGLIAGPALAQTAPAADPAAPVATADKSVTDAQIRAWINDTPPPSATDPHDGVVVDKPLPPQIHGEAGVTFGSGGYRSVYATTIMPLGDNAVLGVAASDTHFGNNRSGWNRAGGNRQTLGLSLAAGDPHAAGPPDGCLQVGGRFVEPLWAEQLRGPDDHCSLRHGEEITQPPRP